MSSIPLLDKNPQLLASRGLTYDQRALLSLNGCNLLDIAETVRTPSWVIGGNILQQRAQHFLQFVSRISPKASCHFAVKSLDHLAVLKTLKQTGIGLDIVSGGELSRALHAGFHPGKIVFSGIGKTDAELEFALKQHIAQINVETVGELKRLNKIASASGMMTPVALRINPHLGYGECSKITTGNKSDKFGISWTEINHLWPLISKEMKNIHLQGIAVHGGSQILDASKFRHFYQHIAKLVAMWKKNGFNIQTLDCGGGFGIPYSFQDKPLSLEKMGEIISQTLVPLSVTLRFEPGRYISGPSAVLLSRITEIKKTDSGTFIILDSGMNDLLRPALYDASHEILPLLKPNKATAKETYHIVGPVCESSDFFRRNYTLPTLQRGDKVAILDVGAYGSVMSSTYNSRPLAPIILAYNERYEIIRKRQTIEEIISTEIIPPWL